MWSTLSPTPTSTVPCSRSKLAVCVHDGHVYMLGGRNGSIPVRDFWKYSLTDHTWSEIKSTGDVPSNLQDHSIVGWKGRLYVFGGEVGFASTGETPLWVYDIATNRWQKRSKNGSGSLPRPQGCRGHTAVIYDGAMHIYGGYRDLKGSTNELWSFDFEKECWHLVTYKGNVEVPSGRHNHSVVIHDAAMWVYGGMTDLQAKNDFWKWDFVSRHWSRVRCKGGPGDLHGHTACRVMSTMVIFGGERTGQLQNEVWRFHFATDVWEKLGSNGTQPSPRSRHFAVVVPTLLLLLPHLYDGQQQQQSSPPRQQKQFQELVSSGSCAPNDRWDLEPPSVPLRLPKSETISNCREVSAVPEDSGGGRKIASSFSQNNFKYLRERISTSSLFKMQNASYVALNNSSESVREDSERGEAPTTVAVVDRAAIRTTQSVYAFPFAVDSGRNSVRFGGRTLLSVPNFQRIQAQELRGLMEDMSDSSSVDMPSRSHEDRTAPMAEMRPAEEGPIRVAFGQQRRSLVLQQDIASRNGTSFPDPRLVCPQDSLESIPDIKDFISPDIAIGKGFPEDASSVKLIDLEADCDGTMEEPGDEDWSEWPLPADMRRGSDGPRQPTIPKSLSCLEETQTRQALPVVNENSAWESHRDYASCLNVVTTPDGRRLSALEMKTFPCLPDCDEGISEDIFSEENLSPETHQGDELHNNGMDGQITSNPLSMTKTQSTCKDTDGYKASNARHFSMLVLGGREQGLNGCGRRPMTIWKLDFWK